MKIKDVNAQYIEDDVEKIKRKPLMYIRQFGQEGVLHLIWEVIQNAFDECIDMDSPGDKIKITYDNKTNELTVKENGRGFPEMNFSLPIYCTKLQSGSKFDRQSGGTSGEFGVGLTVVNALSNSFSIESYRHNEKKKHKIVFEHGVLIEDETKAIQTKKAKFTHGSIVSCIPSEEYFGETKIPFDLVKERVKKIMHIIHTQKDIQVELIEMEDNLILSTERYQKAPFEELITTCPFELQLPISIFEITTEIPPDSEKRLHGGPLNLDVVFSYATEGWYDSYCNFTNTIDGGIHVDAVEEILCRYLQSETKKRLSEKEKEKLDITWNDVKSGLVLLVNMNTVEEVFIGNAKTKITKTELVPYLKKAFGDVVKNYFAENQTTLNKICAFIKNTAKMRLEINKVRSGKGTVKNRFDEYRYGTKYTPANNRGKNEKRELFLVEGDSALNMDCRDTKTQAFLCFRGNPANVYSKKVHELLDVKSGNREWVRFVDVIGTGWGSMFNPDKCYFNRINILTDADVDGLGISAAMAGFIVKVLYPLIERGIVYKVLPPLYQTKDPKHEFVHDKKEMVEIYNKKIVKSIPISLDGKEKLDNKTYKEFLYDTIDTLNDLIAIYEKNHTSPYVIESFLSASIKYAKRKKINTKRITKELLLDWSVKDDFNTILMNEINRFMPEMKMEQNGFFTGTYFGKAVILIIDKSLIKMVFPLLPIFEKYGCSYYVKEESVEGFKPIPLYDLLQLQSRIYPGIKSRYKGLGEMDGEQLWDTVLNPEIRYSIQLTTDNYEKELGLMHVLYGSKEENIKERKQIIQSYHVQPFDIDS